MKKYFLFAFLGLLTWACSDNSDSDSSNDDDAIPTPIFIDIVYNESAADVSIPATAVGVTCTSGSATDVEITVDDTITTEYYYRVKGESSSGSLTINSPYKLTMLLQGLDLTSQTTSPAIHVNCGKRVALILQENTVNTLTDNAMNEKKGCFYTKGHLEIEGGGVLNITSHARHALAAKEYLQLKKSTGYINILGAPGDGIHCGEGDGDPENNYFKINGGTVTFTDVEGDLIDCDDYGTAYINGGTLYLTVAADDAKGLKADSLIHMTDGTVHLDVSGTSSVGIQANYEAYFSGGTITGTVSGLDASGVKGNNAKSSVTVLDGGNLYFSGTQLTLGITGLASCYGVNAEKNISVTGGTLAFSGPAVNAPGYRVKGELSGSDYILWTAVEE
jgi:hypothetical protein